jgi:predicted DNA binding CopG/RHH family protein
MKLKTAQVKQVTSLRVSPSDMRAIKAKAKTYGVSVSEWLRQAGLKWLPVAKDLD